MSDLIGKRFTVHGLEYVVLSKVDKEGKQWRVSPIGNPRVSQTLPEDFIEDLLEKEKHTDLTLLDKLNMVNTQGTKITLDVSEDEFNFIKTWVEVGMKYEEINNR